MDPTISVIFALSFLKVICFVIVLTGIILNVLQMPLMRRCQYLMSLIATLSTCIDNVLVGRICFGMLGVVTLLNVELMELVEMTLLDFLESLIEDLGELVSWAIEECQSLYENGPEIIPFSLILHEGWEMFVSWGYASLEEELI
jgi:hypothetical protein